MSETTNRPIALITGASRRIGRAIALDLARAGWSIALHYRNSREDAAALAAKIKELGVAVAILPGDLSKPADLMSLIPRCSAALGPVTCLVNNASLFEYDDLASLDLNTLEDHLAVNLNAPILLAQAFAAQLPVVDAGNIINIIDQRAWAPTPEFFSYTLSKTALWSATRMMAQALGPRIRVNAVGPGPTLPNVHQKAEDFDAEVTSTLLQRSTQPEEIARAIRFILDAPAMTGQMIALDGGQHLRWFPEVAPVKT